MGNLTVKRVPVRDAVTADEGEKNVRDLFRTVESKTDEAAGAEWAGYGIIGRFGWSHADVVERGVNVSAGKFSKASSVITALRFIAGDDVVSDLSDSKREKVLDHAARLQTWWEAEQTVEASQGRTLDGLAGLAQSLTGQDGDERSYAVAMLYNRLGSVGSGAYEVASGSKVHPSLVVDSEPEQGEPEPDQGGEQNDEDPIAKLQGMAATMRAYADKHGVSLVEALGIVTAAFK